MVVDEHDFLGTQGQRYTKNPIGYPVDRLMITGGSGSGDGGAGHAVLDGHHRHGLDRCGRGLALTVGGYCFEHVQDRRRCALLKNWPGDNNWLSTDAPQALTSATSTPTASAARAWRSSAVSNIHLDRRAR